MILVVEKNTVFDKSWIFIDNISFLLLSMKRKISNSAIVNVLIVSIPIFVNIILPFS
jgi:hypothetical protein